MIQPRSQYDPGTVTLTISWATHSSGSVFQLKPDSVIDTRRTAGLATKPTGGKSHGVLRQGRSHTWPASLAYGIQSQALTDADGAGSLGARRAGGAKRATTCCA